MVYCVFLAGDIVQGVYGDVDRQIDGTQQVHVMGVIQNPNQCLCHVQYSNPYSIFMSKGIFRNFQNFTVDYAELVDTGLM